MSCIWKSLLRRNFTNWNTLADFLQLSDQQRQQIDPASSFSLNLPYRLAQKIEKGTLADPLLVQFLPTKEEQKERVGFTCDPVGDQLSRKTPKLLKKYPGRALLLCTSACAMHCRYCFRQHFSYDTKDKLFYNELKAIEEDRSIGEVILSGGDPLSLSDSYLHQLINDLEQIPHVKRLRFHSRFLIGIPERIDASFLSLFEKTRLGLWFVVHCNHPRELDEDILSAIKALKRTGFNLLNQSVLLKGVNDEVEILVELCEKLVEYGVLPYYLHQLDRARGTEHFEVTKTKGTHLINCLTKRLSGYAVPKYVCEIAGESSKTAL